jgi:RimJ/RimL family protein N-acetyltransferase
MRLCFYIDREIHHHFPVLCVSHHTFASTHSIAQVHPLVGSSRVNFGAYQGTIMSFSVLHQQVASLFNHHTSRNLAFRTFARADAWPLLTATQNPDFNRFLLWDAPKDISVMMIQVEKLLREHQLSRCVALSVVDRDNGSWKALGLIKGFRDGVEMSLYLHPCAWNTGLVLMSGCAIIELLLQQFPEQPIYNRVIVGNRRMARLNISYGFEKMDEVQDVHANGEARILDVFKLNRNKWKPFDGIASY